MENSGISVSIIIVLWNNESVIRDCLKSVLDQRGESGEIIVVDNNSSDRSAAIVEKEFSGVKLIENESNKGFAAAANQGIRASQGDYLLLLNPDAVMSAGSLEKMFFFLKDHPDAGACGCRIEDESGKLMWSCFHFPSLSGEFWEITLLSRLFPRSRLFGRYLMSYWDHNTSREVDWLTGACLMLRKEALDNAGLLDEEFFMYTEDVDLCYRLRNNRYRIYYLADTRIVHKQGNSADQNYARMFAQRYKSRYLFFKKHYGLMRYALLKMIVLLGFAARTAVYLPARVFIRDKYAAKRKLSGYLEVLKTAFS